MRLGGRGHAFIIPQLAWPASNGCLALSSPPGPAGAPDCAPHQPL